MVTRRNARQYPRTARLNRLLQEIVAETLESIDDERLELLTVTAVEVEPDLRHALVFYDSLQGEAGDDEVLEALAEVRPRLQRAIGREARVKRTPELSFRPDPAVREASRIEAILAEIGPLPPAEPDAAGTSRPEHRSGGGRTDAAGTPAPSIEGGGSRRRRDRPRRGPVGTTTDVTDPATAEPLRDGLAIVDKEAGWTSHDVVAKARGILHNKKIGHSGTLDPDATGVLVLGVGQATRLLQFLTVLPKQYVGDVVLGVETTTLDASGEVTATYDMSTVTLDEARAAAAGPDRRHLADPADGVGGAGRREAAPRARPPGDRGRARRAAGHRAPVRPARGARPAPACCEPRSTAPRAPTCAAWPPTWAGLWAAGPICATCGARPSARARWPTPAHSTRSIVRPIEDAVRQLASRLRLISTGRPPSVTARCSSESDAGHPVHRRMGNDPDGPWAVLGPDGRLLAVYEAHQGTTVKPAVVVVSRATVSLDRDAGPPPPRPGACPRRECVVTIREPTTGVHRATRRSSSWCASWPSSAGWTRPWSPSIATRRAWSVPTRRPSCCAISISASSYWPPPGWTTRW